MSTIQSGDIHKDVRIIGCLIRKFMPAFTEQKLCKLSSTCKKMLRGRWLGRHTSIEERYIKRSNGSSMRIVICRSKKGTQANATGLLWIHGGGYAIGAPEQDFFFVDSMVADGNCVAVMPAYTLSTEAPYPAALDDCYLTLLWMKEHAYELSINPNQLFVGGDSAGGGLTAAVCLYARDQKEVNIAFQMPLYPMIDDRMITPSSQNNDAPVWDSAKNEMAWAMYLKGTNKEDLPIYAAPARAEDLRGLPPVCTYVGTIEPFYDETVDFVNRLREQDVEVHFKEYPGCFHAFDMMGMFTGVGKDAKTFLMNNFHYAQEYYFAPNK